MSRILILGALAAALIISGNDADQIENICASDEADRASNTAGDIANQRCFSDEVEMLQQKSGREVSLRKRQRILADGSLRKADDLGNAIDLASFDFRLEGFFRRAVPNSLISNCSDSKKHRSIAVFLHQNKAAGSTIKCMLGMDRATKSRHLSDPSHVECDESHFLRGRCAVPKKATVVAGGFVMAIPESKMQGCSPERPCTFFTMFREPVSRLVSAYMYCQNRGRGDPLCGSEVLNAKKASLETFAAHWGNYLFRQFLIMNFVPKQLKQRARPVWWQQKKLLARRDTEETAQGRQALRKVISGLPRLFKVVGLVEEYDKSMTLFKEAMPNLMSWDKLTDSSHTCYKANSHSQARDAKAKRLLKSARNNPKILRHISADLKIYAAAKQIFKRQQNLRTCV